MMKIIGWKDIVKPGILIGNLDLVQRGSTFELLPTCKKKFSVIEDPICKARYVPKSFNTTGLIPQKIIAFNDYAKVVTMELLEIQDSKTWKENEINEFIDSVFDDYLLGYGGAHRRMDLLLQLNDECSNEYDESEEASGFTFDLPMEEPLGVTTGRFVATLGSATMYDCVTIWHELITPNYGLRFFPFQILGEKTGRRLSLKSTCFHESSSND